MQTPTIMRFAPVAPPAVVKYPRFQDTVLPVPDLDRAVHFYTAVFGLQRLDRDGRRSFALLGREYARLSLYGIPGYTPPTLADPVLSCAAPPLEFDLLEMRIREHGGTVIARPDYIDPVPRLLFTDPGPANLIECRGVLTLRPAAA